MAVSSNLNVSEDDFKNVPGGVFFFRNKVQPKDVIQLLDQIEPSASWANDQVIITFGNSTIHDSEPVVQRP